MLSNPATAAWLRRKSESRSRFAFTPNLFRTLALKSRSGSLCAMSMNTANETYDLLQQTFGDEELTENRGKATITPASRQRS